MFGQWFAKNKWERPNGRYRPSRERLIELRQVTKVYETPTGPFTALHQVNLQLDHGQFAVVVGQSGSGKSTLINMVAGLDRPTSGEVWVGDTAVHALLDVDRLTAWRGRTVGVIFEVCRLWPGLSAVKNVMLPMDFCDVYGRGERYERAMHLLEQVGLAGQAHQLPSALSGSEQQRVAIARALANDPPLLAADEPTGNLDAPAAELVLQLFAQLAAQGKTILMVTGNVEVAERAGCILTLAGGKIVTGMRSSADLTGIPSYAELEGSKCLS